MRAYSLKHLSDAVLLRDLTDLVAQDRTTTAALLAHLAEVDTRKLYLPAGYPSMYAYCVDELRLSEDAAYKRIQAARAARQFPALFAAIADGRLSLSAVCILAPHLTPENVQELLGAAAGKSKSEIEGLLVRRFPRPEMLPMVEAIPASALLTSSQLAPRQVEDVSAQPKAHPTQLIPESPAPSIRQLAPGQVEQPGSRSRVAPLAPERFALHVTIGQGTHDKLRYVQELLSHAIPSADLGQVLDRALDALIGQLERRKFAATSKPRPVRHASTRERHIPAHVRQAVWKRDQGQCTFVSESGRRCSARKFLEFDHIDPVARGGKAMVERMRLRCRAHNQYEAERTFGAGFMSQKREQARLAVAETRARAAAEETREQEVAREQAGDVLAGLRELGVRSDKARRAAEFSATVPCTSLEERMRAALKVLCPKTG